MPNYVAGQRVQLVGTTVAGFDLVAAREKYPPNELIPNDARGTIHRVRYNATERLPRRYIVAFDGSPYRWDVDENELRALTDEELEGERGVLHYVVVSIPIYAQDVKTAETEIAKRLDKAGFPHYTINGKPNIDVVVADETMMRVEAAMRAVWNDNKTSGRTTNKPYQAGFLEAQACGLTDTEATAIVSTVAEKLR